MQIVIDIDEEEYRAISINKGVPYHLSHSIGNAILNGTPLLEPHGDLKDATAIEKEMLNYRDDCAQTSEYTRLGFETAMEVVKDAETIIPAIEEKSCATCGQPRNYTGDCILFMERKCVARYEKWISATKEGDGE